MDLPDFFIERMRKYYPEETESYLESFREPRHYGLRANTLKITPERLRDLLPFDVEPVLWCKEGFYYEERERPAKNPYYHAGLYYIQEPSAMAPGSVFDIHPGDTVLDMCAAPGGKSTQVAGKLCGQGLLVSNDVSNTRCRGLLRNIELMGVKNCVILNETPEKLLRVFNGYFDKILIDAPCSGEGMFRKDEEAVKSYTRFKSEQCTVMQRNILYHAAGMLKSGGQIMYSTCTFAPEENEGMIGAFLEEHDDFFLCPIDRGFGLEPGHPEFYKNMKELEGTSRIWPHKLRGEGHFLAILQKKGEPEETMGLREHPKQREVKEIHYFHEFCEKWLDTRFQGEFTVHGSSLYRVPEGIPDLRGIRIIREGLYLGELKIKRFEPSQAFAMTLEKSDARYAIDFPAEDERVLRYLRGESFEVEACEGYNLICASGYPIGFGKVQDGRMKNKYLKSWVINY